MRQCRVLSKRRSVCFWVSDPWCQRHSSSGWDDTPGQSWRRSSAPATIHEPGDMWGWWGETRSCCCTSSCLCRLQLVEDEFIRCELQTDEQHQSSLHHPHTYSPHQVKYYSVLRTQPDNTLTIVILPLHCKYNATNDSKDCRVEESNCVDKSLKIFSSIFVLDELVVWTKTDLCTATHPASAEPSQNTLQLS